MEPRCPVFADCIEQLDDLLLTYTVVDALEQLPQFFSHLCTGFSLLFHAVHQLEMDQLVDIEVVRWRLLIGTLVK